MFAIPVGWPGASVSSLSDASKTTGGTDGEEVIGTGLCTAPDTIAAKESAASFLSRPFTGSRIWPPGMKSETFRTGSAMSCRTVSESVEG